MLDTILIDRIRTNGPVSFRDFMETTLYHDEMGYYTTAANRIGCNGDYYTSPEVTPLFGALIGRQIEEMWEAVGKGDFTIVEFGAGTGKMCRDILAYLKTNPPLYANLSYAIIEKSRGMRELEKSHLCEKVSWFENIGDIPAFNGCIISNELLDNFPVHQVVMKERLMEVFVDYKDGFIETLIPAHQELQDYFSELRVALPKDFRAEVNLAAKHWLNDIAAVLKKGYVLTIDYGHTSTELYSDTRSAGTVMCFKAHTANQLPYSDIGQQDITSHVNFSALSHFGHLCGLENCGLTTQASFLLGLGFNNFIKACEKHGYAGSSEQYNKLYYKLIADMGPKFKVLIQKKGEISSELLGLRL
jgi:SAM-dependent MidA family methyltransferase